MKISLLLIITILQFSFIAYSQNVAIDEKKYVSLGEIEQWVTIKGDDIDNPAILFLHGGPGSVLSPFCENIYGEWEREFVLVNWDQRGAGKTFGKNAPSEPNESYWIENKLTVEKIVQDGIELAEYLVSHLKKEKIILVGTSWGSILGINMILKRPDLFSAYLGHAQFVDFLENVRFAYNEVLRLALESEDSTAVQKLKSLGRPPYDDARSLGQMLKIVKAYESKRSTPEPDKWWKINKPYDSEEDRRDRYNGDDYSFLYFAGHEEFGIRSIVEEVDFNKETKFELPVYFIQGENDLLTATEVNKSYFEKIKAPHKEYHLVPDAGHGHNESVVEMHYQVLKKISLDEVNK